MDSQLIDQCFSNFFVLRTGNLERRAARPLVIKYHFKKIDVGGA